jgi:hypothetical protein
MAEYNKKIAARGEAARGALSVEAYLAAAKEAGVSSAVLEALSFDEQEAKTADQEQRRLRSSAKARGAALQRDLAAVKRAYTVFRERRETRKPLLRDRPQLLAVLAVDYARKRRVAGVDDAGAPTAALVDSRAMGDELREISDAVGAVLAEPALVASFAEVEYGPEKLAALKARAEELLAEKKAVAVLRALAEDATRRERAAVDRVNGAWKLYGPQLRRAAGEIPGMGALLEGA